MKKVIAILGTLVMSCMLMMEPTYTQSLGYQQATPIVVQDLKNAEMVYVPSGTFRIGTTKDAIDRLCTQFETEESQQVQTESCTDLLTRGGVLNGDTIKISPFWIDKYEVTLDQYHECVDSGSCINIDLSRSPELASPGTKPQVGVNWYEAVRFCNYRGARLPTEEEWQYAASGPDNNIFPWGDSLESDYLSSFDSTHPVGTIAGDRSWIGVYDMGGNVSEWVENLYLPYSGIPADWSEFSEVDRVSRGGSWGSGELLWASFLRTSLYPEDSYPTQGFRCVRSSPPPIDTNK